jgi:RNA polymerase sigma factor (sigma-70 family)
MRQLKITKSITNRESASLDKYLQEIGREDLITVEEEVELAQRIRKGDRVALEKLTRANLRFVVSVAKQYQNQGLSLPDLINEGNLGLIKAAEKFDETRGFKFISYAVWWIRQSILQALAEQSRIVRLPLNQVGSLNKISKAFSKFEQENERLSFRLLSRLYMNNCMYRILGCLSQIDRLHINRIQSSQSCILTLLEHIIKSQTFILFRLQHSISRYSRYTCANSYNRRCP